MSLKSSDWKTFMKDRPFKWSTFFRGLISQSISNKSRLSYLEIDYSFIRDFESTSLLSTDLRKLFGDLWLCSIFVLRILTVSSSEIYDFLTNSSSIFQICFGDFENSSEMTSVSSCIFFYGLLGDSIDLSLEYKVFWTDQNDF